MTFTRRTRCRTLALKCCATGLISVLGSISGCVSSDPISMDAGAGGVGGTRGSIGTGVSAARLAAGARNSHFPLVEGATWIYRHTNPTKPSWDETNTIKSTTYLGRPAFIYSDEEDAQGLRTHSTLEVRDSRVFRVYKETAVTGQVALTVTYDPGFLRFDEAWNADGQTVTLTNNWTQNCVLMSAASKCAPGSIKPGMSRHIWTVLKASTTVTVPAGTFEAIQIERVAPVKNETTIFWFAAGVGKVREETPAAQAIEELLSFEIR